MDMSPAYLKSAKTQIALEEERIVHNRFHAMKSANNRWARFAKTEHRRLSD